MTVSQDPVDGAYAYHQVRFLDPDPLNMEQPSSIERACPKCVTMRLVEIRVFSTLIICWEVGRSTTERAAQSSHVDT